MRGETSREDVLHPSPPSVDEANICHESAQDLMLISQSGSRATVCSLKRKVHILLYVCTTAHIWENSIK